MNLYCTPMTAVAGGLQRLRLHTPNGAEVDIFSQGAHVARWRSARGREVLFLSDNASFAPGSAIRGGVPIIFPQFNQLGPYQRHGFARVSEWRLLGEPTETRGRVTCQFGLESTKETRKSWPFEFRARLLVSLGDERLRLALRVENTGDQIMQFTAALHTYLRVDDIASSRLDGLAETTYWDNDGRPFSERSAASHQPLRLQDGPIDRVYFGARKPLVLHDGKQRLEISQTGFGDVVVWNPGEVAARQLSDLADGEYRHMLCVEAARIERPVHLRPDTSWEGGQTLTCL